MGGWGWGFCFFGLGFFSFLFYLVQCYTREILGLPSPGVSWKVLGSAEHCAVSPQWHKAPIS